MDKITNLLKSGEDLALKLLAVIVIFAIVLIFIKKFWLKN